MNEEEVKKIADQYYDFTVKQGWKLAGFEPEIRKASYKYAEQICQLFEPKLYLDSPLDKLSKPDEVEARAIDCFTECVHYQSCIPFVNPVACTGKEPKPDERLPELMQNEYEDILSHKEKVTIGNNNLHNAIDKIAEFMVAKTASILKTEYDKLVTEAQDKGYKLAEAECSKKIEEIFRDLDDKAHATDFIDHIRLNIDFLDYQAIKDKYKKESDDLYR